MTAAEILFNLLLIAVVWGALNWQNLREVRKDRDLYRRDAKHNFDVADAAQATVKRLRKELVAEHVKTVSAEKYAAEMQRQRDDARRRLAAATQPKMEVYK